MTVHLMTTDKFDSPIACGVAKPCSATTDTARITCGRCKRRIPRVQAERAEVARLARLEKACSQVGLADSWAKLSDDTPSVRMLREMLGAVALYLIETGEAVNAA